MISWSPGCWASQVQHTAWCGSEAPGRASGMLGKHSTYRVPTSHSSVILKLTFYDLLVQLSSRLFHVFAKHYKLPITSLLIFKSYFFKDLKGLFELTSSSGSTFRPTTTGFSCWGGKTQGAWLHFPYNHRQVLGFRGDPSPGVERQSKMWGSQSWDFLTSRPPVTVENCTEKLGTKHGSPWAHNKTQTEAAPKLLDI